MEENKNSDTKGPTLIVILSIMLVVICACIVFDKMYTNKSNQSNKKDDKPVVKKTEYEDLNINSDLVKNSYSMIKITRGMCNMLDVTYKEKYQKVSDFSNDLRLALAWFNVNNDYKKLDGVENVIEEKYLEEAFNNLFGKNAIYYSSNFKFGFDSMTYDKEKKEYRTNNEMRPLPGRCAVDQLEQIIEAKKNKEYLVITTATAYCNYEVCYSDFKQENEIGDSKIDFKSVKDKLRKFRYTFNTNDGAKYYFYSVENLND